MEDGCVNWFFSEIGSALKSDVRFTYGSCGGMLPRGRGGLRAEAERLTEVMFVESSSLPPSCKALSKSASGDKRDDRSTISEILFLFHLLLPQNLVFHILLNYLGYYQFLIQESTAVSLSEVDRSVPVKADNQLGGEVRKSCDSKRANSRIFPISYGYQQ